MASTDRYGKQISSQSEFLASCRAHVNDSFAELNGLLAEIRAAGVEPKLRLFIAYKEFEMEVSFGKIAQEHCNKLIGLFKAETDQARDALSLSCVIAQEEFLLLRGNHVHGDLALKEQQDALLTMLDNKAGVRFNDENLQDTVTQLMDLSEAADGLATPQSEHRMTYNVGEVLSAMAETRKRRNLFVDQSAEESSAVQSSKVRIVSPPTNGSSVLDQTVVVLPVQSNGVGGLDGVEMLSNEDAMNGTFQMPAKSSGQLNETVNFITKNVLKEQSLNKIMNQPGLLTKMTKVTKTASRPGDNVSGGGGGRQGVKKAVVLLDGGGGRSSPNRVAKARLAASRAGVAALKSKGGGGGGSAQKWK